jgi:hypothetical protein
LNLAELEASEIGGAPAVVPYNFFWTAAELTCPYDGQFPGDRDAPFDGIDFVGNAIVKGSASPDQLLRRDQLERELRKNVQR